MVTQTVRQYPTTDKHDLAIQKQSSRYTSQSELYHLKGGFEAEVIRSPFAHLLKEGTYSQAFRELQLVTMKAFEKPLDDTHVYAPKEVMDKNVLTADWLIVVRKNNRPVAFSSGSYVRSFLFYLNGAMIDPNYQLSGIGFITNALLWKLVYEESKLNCCEEIDFICRTKNKNVVSGLSRLFNDNTISSESTTSTYSKMLFKIVKEYLKCDYDTVTGIAKKVYPKGLPSGTKSVSIRIENAFEKIGERDACFFTGKLNQRYVDGLLKKKVIGNEKLHNCRNKVLMQDCA